MNSVIEGIREFISACPLFENGYIHVNYLDLGKLSYTIDEVPANPVIKQYVDGSSRRQALFLFASSETYSRDAVENLKTCGFYEAFSDWLDEQSDKGNLPQLPPGCTAQYIKATTNGCSFITDPEQMKQRYQIQCQLAYLKE